MRLVDGLVDQIDLIMNLNLIMILVIVIVVLMDWIVLWDDVM